MRKQLTTTIEESMTRAIKIMAMDLKCGVNDIIEALFFLHSQEEIEELVTRYMGDKKEL